MNQAPTQNITTSIASNLDVKEESFLSESENDGIPQRGIPIAGKFKVARVIDGNNQEIEVNAIGEYKVPPSNTKTYVLGSVNGVIQWLETEECEE